MAETVPGFIHLPKDTAEVRRCHTFWYPESDISCVKHEQLTVAELKELETGHNQRQDKRKEPSGEQDLQGQAKKQEHNNPHWLVVPDELYCPDCCRVGMAMVPLTNPDTLEDWLAVMGSKPWSGQPVELQMVWRSMIQSVRPDLEVDLADVCKGITTDALAEPLPQEAG
ncbi:TPA: hypothetical protein ACH3X2_006809 [Trebouxia sp. C0005]